MLYLYGHVQRKKIDEWKILASMHGITIKDEPKDSKDDMFDFGSNAPGPKNDMLFGDPADYENMTDDEKEALTQRMMSNHKQFAGSTALGVK